MKHSRNQEKGVQNPSSVTRRKPSGSRAAMLSRPPPAWRTMGTATTRETTIITKSTASVLTTDRSPPLVRQMTSSRQMIRQKVMLNPVMVYRTAQAMVNWEDSNATFEQMCITLASNFTAGEYRFPR